jgi:precorrin-2/cobalt-factor-2 C20-methyltransferase
VRIVPGITAFQAAARTGTVLCEGTESLRVVAGISDEEALTREMNDADTVVLV